MKRQKTPENSSIQRHLQNKMNDKHNIIVSPLNLSFAELVVD